jgi:hypothetical protein
MELEQSGISAGFIDSSFSSTTTSSQRNVGNEGEGQYTSTMLNMSLFQSGLPESYLQQVNQLIASHSESTAITFLYLPRPPSSLRPDEGVKLIPNGNATVTRGERLDYLHQLTVLTNNLPPTVLVHGLHAVMSS